jgi:hypothetical protein
MVGPNRRSALKASAAAGAWLVLGSASRSQENFAPPKLGRYKVEGVTGWIRDLVIENEKDYTVYEARNGPFYGRGTYSFDGRYVRFQSGPYYEMGAWGSSFRLDDGKHRMRLGGFEATSLD